MNRTSQKRALILLLTLTLLLALASCAAKSPLVGVWQEVDIDNIYTFNANGTGEEYYDGSTWALTWTLNGGTLTMDFGTAGVEAYKIEIKGNTLIVHGDEVDFEYKRK
ncbi:MAG: lipocalin family protein [Oscillospiraceae bacterium]|jgi:hypothetical protein|nr:lipocalin family protein [Oscillospiraceae bacterium]